MPAAEAAAPSLPPHKTLPAEKDGDSRTEIEVLGKQVDMWNTREITSFYGSYASQYDQEIETDRTSYPGPFKIGNWCIEWLINQGLEQRMSRKRNSMNNGEEDQHAEADMRSIRVLDLGCGTGQSCQSFIDHALQDSRFKYELIGMDTTPEMLKRAQERPFKHLVVHDLELFPYPALDGQLSMQSFDILVCVGVMDFIAKPSHFLRHIRSFMRPNRALVGEETASKLPASILGLTLPERHSHSDLSSFSRIEMERLLRESGFWIERHERFLGYADSKTGLIQYYHGWLCVLTDDE